MMLRRYHEHPEPGEQPGKDNGPDRTERPARSASKADWVAYAVTQGAEQNEAEQLTKEALYEEYGG